MTSAERFKKIVLVMRSAQHAVLTSKEVAKTYMQNPTSSDSLSTGTILNVMALLGYVVRKERPRGQRAYIVTYQATQKINTIEGV
jgi:hypothetical protein